MGFFVITPDNDCDVKMLCNRLQWEKTYSNTKEIIAIFDVLTQMIHMYGLTNIGQSGQASVVKNSGKFVDDGEVLR